MAKFLQGMNPEQLRFWMRRYGNAGVVAVAVYLALRWMCLNPWRRAVLLLSITATFAIGTWSSYLLFKPVPRHPYKAPLAPVVVEAVPAISPPVDSIRRSDDNEIDAVVAFGKAAERGDIATVRRLLKEGVPIESGTDDTGRTALNRAAMGGQTEVLRFLLSQGADVQSHTEEGTSVLMDAAGSGRLDCVRLLLHHGADARGFGRFDSPLTCAIHKGGLPMVKLLVRAGADLDVGGFYTTPLEQAAECGDTAIVGYLLDKGVNVDEESRWGRTPLMRAALCGNVRVVRLLIARGADVNAEGTVELENSHRHESPLALAEQNKHPEVIRILQRAGASR